MSTNINNLDAFEPSKAGAYDAGAIRVFFDNRTFKGFADKLPFWQSYYLESLSRLSWTSIYSINDLAPGYIRLIFYTHVGNQGTRDYPLHKAMAVKEMFDSLSAEGFRPMILGWSNENPFPMIGGVEPPPPPKKKEPKRATTWSGTSSGHSAEGTPHDRVMAIIKDEEEREEKLRRQEFEALELQMGGSVA